MVIFHSKLWVLPKTYRVSRCFKSLFGNLTRMPRGAQRTYGWWFGNMDPIDIPQIWLVVWNIWKNAQFCWDDDPIWRIHIFQGGRSTTNKLNVSIYTSTMDPMGEFNMFTGLTAMSNGGKWHNEEPQFSRGHRSVAQLLYYIMKPSNVGFSTSDKKIPMLFKLFKLPFN